MPDVIVVGAGPGGSAAAALLARAGADVLVLDRVEFPRDKACGGGLTPRGVAALQAVGVSIDTASFVEVGGVEMIGYGRSAATRFPTTRAWPDTGLVARRVDLDGAVLEQAMKAGVRFRRARVAGPVFEDGTCRGVRLSGGEEIRGGQVIAADGATSVLARGAGLAPGTSSGAGFWYAAMRGYFGPVMPRVLEGRPVLEFYPLRSSDGRWLPGYGWVFPLPDGAANVGVDLPHRPRLRGAPPLRQAYESFVDRLGRERHGFADAVEESPPVGALLPEGMRDFRAGAPGLLCLGDAAGLITPYSGEGIVYALESARLAARAIVDVARPSAVHETYASGLRDAYGFQFRAAMLFMKGVRRAPLARLAAAAGVGRPRVLRAAVRVMAYLIDERPTSSTVSNAWHLVRRAVGD
jgi:geranylgeranyl reductase family protein